MTVIINASTNLDQTYINRHYWSIINQTNDNSETINSTNSFNKYYEFYNKTALIQQQNSTVTARQLTKQPPTYLPHYMEHSLKVKLKTNGNKAPPCFKPF